MPKEVYIFMPGDKLAILQAGPTRNKPPSHLLIRCASEIPVDESHVFTDISVPDFQTFNMNELEKKIPLIMHALETGKPPNLYVGCAGGIGRTGTILSILAAHHPDMTPYKAIEYIRTTYHPHACETREQEEQVRWYYEDHIRSGRPPELLSELKFTKSSLWDRFKKAWSRP